jgi:non-specific serine/threonine protein kinase
VIAGRITEARHWLAATLGHDTGAPDERTGALALAAWFATHQGDVDEAESLLDEAGRFLGAASSRVRCLILRAQGGLAARRGDLDRADVVFTDLVDLALREDRTGAAAEGWLLLALTRVLAGRTDDAERALRRCLTLADRAGDSQTRASALGVRALGALSAGETCTALTAARTALRSKVEIGDWFAVALLLELVAWVALSEDDPVRAAVLLGAAARLWRQVGLTPASMGPLAVGRDGRLVAARDALGRRDFDRHLARGAALDLSEVLRYAEDDVLPGQPKPNPATSLTSRELAVAELVARGMSNRDIAAVLVISVHTVQGHVEKILRKLGFGSRAQVAAWVAHRSLETAR